MKRDILSGQKLIYHIIERTSSLFPDGEISDKKEWESVSKEFEFSG